jgi:hypothetical protein
MIRFRPIPPIVLIAAAFLIASDPGPVRSQAVELVVVDVHAVVQGYRVSKLTGRDVVNDGDQEIGSIDDFIIAGREHAPFTVLEVGGFLGVGGHLVAVPFASLALEDGGRRIKLPGASKKALEKLPVFHYGA